MRNGDGLGVAARTSGNRVLACPSYDSVDVGVREGRETVGSLEEKYGITDEVVRTQ